MSEIKLEINNYSSSEWDRAEFREPGGVLIEKEMTPSKRLMAGSGQTTLSYSEGATIITGTNNYTDITYKVSDNAWFKVVLVVPFQEFDIGHHPWWEFITGYHAAGSYKTASQSITITDPVFKYELTPTVAHRSLDLKVAILDTKPPQPTEKE